jgi:hypothetical protein
MVNTTLWPTYENVNFLFVMLNSHQTSIFEELARCFPFNIVEHASPMKFNIGVEHASPMKTWMLAALNGGLSCMVQLK